MRGQLDIDNPRIPEEAIVSPILSVCSSASQALLLVDDHPLTHEKRRVRMAQFLERVSQPSAGTSALIGLFRRQDHAALEELLHICVGPGSWFSTYIYLAPTSCTLLIWESSLIDV